MPERNSLNLPSSHRDSIGRGSFQEANFFPVDLDYAGPGIMEMPAKVEELCEVWKRQNIIVLGGDHLHEKLTLAHQVAWFLKNHTSVEMEILQWQPSETPQRFLSSMKRYPQHTIFILPDVRPFHLGHDLMPLKNGLHGQYVIVTTESRKAQWGQSIGLLSPGVWQEVRQRDLYDESYLVGCLVDELEKSEQYLPQNLRLRNWSTEDSLLVGGLSLAETVNRLASPSRIAILVSALRGVEENEVQESWLRDKISQLENDEHSVGRWFRALGDREQLLVLGLTIFDGLFDDQVFAALEVLIDRSWRSWDPLFQHFDYHELSSIGAYFEGIDAGSKISHITCSSKHRSALLDAAWQLHRRRILSMLPDLVEMVKSSVGSRQNQDKGPLFGLSKLLSKATKKEREPEPDHSESEAGESTESSRWISHGPARDLFSSPTRGGQLRKAVAGLLSRLSFLSEDSVERILLDLAEDRRQDVQNVSASALAYWYVISTEEARKGSDEGRQKLFELLAEWRSDAFEKEWVSKQGAGKREAGNSFAYVRATIALTLSYASLYDPPGELSEGFRGLFVELARDRNAIVRDRFCSQTVPMVIAWHFEQLEELIWDELIMEPDYFSGIVEGLVTACALRPSGTLDILERWLANALNLSERSSGTIIASRCEVVLSIIAATFGMISDDDEPRRTNYKSSFEKLEFIRGESNHSLVLTCVFVSAIHRAETDLEVTEPFLRRLVSSVGLDHREIVIDALTGVYLRQREILGIESSVELEANEESQAPCGSILVDEVFFPVWEGNLRPLTHVERMLSGWLIVKSDAIQQLALASLNSLARTNLDVAERDWQRERATRSSNSTRERTLPSGSGSTKKLAHLSRVKSWWQRVSVLLVTLRRKSLRVLVANLIPEYLFLFKKDRLLGLEVLDADVESSVLERLKQSPEALSVVDALQKAVTIHQSVLLGLGLGLLSLFLGTVVKF